MLDRYSHVYDMQTYIAFIFTKGGKIASEFACKNYLVLMADILKIKEPSYTALRLVGCSEIVIFLSLQGESQISLRLLKFCSKW